MSVNNFLKGIAFGAIVGGSLGILFAPRSGKETQKKLVDDMDEAADLTVDLTKSLHRFQEAVTDLSATAKELLPSFTQETKRTVDNFRFQAEPRIIEINEQVKKMSGALENK